MMDEMDEIHRIREQYETHRKIDSYQRRGWYPVSWAHHPKPIKDALRAIGIRPKMKCCYENCQRFILSGHPIVDELTYVEGHAGSIIPVPHAWFIYKDEILDLTLKSSETTYHVVTVRYTRQQMMRALERHRYFGSVSEVAMAYTNPMAAHFEFLMKTTPEQRKARLVQMKKDGLTEEQIDELVRKRQFDDLQRVKEA